MNEDAGDLLLGAVLSGEVAADDPRVARLLRDEPWRREQLAAARAALDAVRGAEPERRAALAAARAMPTASGAEHLPALLSQHVGARGRRRRGLVAMALLAAAVALALLLARSWNRAGNAPPEHLGDELMSPRGPVDAAAWPDFRWRADGTGYELEVYELRDDGTRGRRIAFVQDIVAPPWHPDDRLTARTRRIEWLLRSFGPNGPQERVERAALAR
jgi:hypothetical protein